MGPRERPLQLLQLERTEGGAVPALLPAVPAVSAASSAAAAASVTSSLAAGVGARPAASTAPADALVHAVAAARHVDLGVVGFGLCRGIGERTVHGESREGARDKHYCDQLKDADLVMSSGASCCWCCCLAASSLIPMMELMRNGFADEGGDCCEPDPATCSGGDVDVAVAEWSEEAAAAAAAAAAAVEEAGEAGSRARAAAALSESNMVAIVKAARGLKIEENLVICVVLSSH